MEMTRNLNLKKSKKKGFTLIELIIVIAIIGIIALIAIPKFGNAQKEAKINADIASAKTIANATSMLITKEEISTDEIDAAKKYTAGDYIKLGEGVGKTISAQLQNVPKPKSVSGDFYIKITADDDVIVSAGTTGTAADKVLYPTEE